MQPGVVFRIWKSAHFIQLCFSLLFLSHNICVNRQLIIVRRPKGSNWSWLSSPFVLFQPLFVSVLNLFIMQWVAAIHTGALILITAHRLWLHNLGVLPVQWLDDDTKSMAGLYGSLWKQHFHTGLFTPLCLLTSCGWLSGREYNSPDSKIMTLNVCRLERVSRN